MYIYTYIYIHVQPFAFGVSFLLSQISIHDVVLYGMDTISRRLKIIGLVCKRAP